MLIYCDLLGKIVFFPVCLRLYGIRLGEQFGIKISFNNFGFRKLDLFLMNHTQVNSNSTKILFDCIKFLAKICILLAV